MPKRRGDLNTIYISERLQECLRPICRAALTTVVAPMGYGKTTAVNWYLGERAKAEAPLIIRISVYSDNMAVFWKSVQAAFAHAGLALLRDYDCPTDAASGGLLADDLCRALVGERPCYIFIDDFHLLTDGRAAGFLCTLANRLPQNVHLIVASRDRFLSGEETVRLGSRVCPIGTDQLRLNHTELSVYAHRCGAELSEEQVDTLLYASEGWFSAVYLNLRTLSERGELPDSRSDIYTMFTAALIEPLPPRQREFLAVMGLADEFTVEMAKYITGDEDAGSLLTALTEQNAFVRRLPEGGSFRFHHMMKECAGRAFLALEPSKQVLYRRRYGAWYERHRQYLHALAAYRAAADYDSALRVIQSDAGILLASLRPQEVLDFLAECPQTVLAANPAAILVLMRRMFTWRLIPKMMELKGLLLSSLAADPQMTASERGNLLGECDLIESFLKYNDISEMSRLHRSASAQMTRPAISIEPSGGWTFGSPSVLMMFHREAGAAERELAEMDECMPHYYRITGGHGQGAEYIMRAEAAYLQGRFADAQIGLEGAYAAAETNAQENMVLCCDFLSWRLSLAAGTVSRCTPQQRKETLSRQHHAAWLHLWGSAAAYYYALLGAPQRVPELFREHRLATVNFLAPGKPMMEMIENQVYLAQGAFARVIGRCAAQRETCRSMHYALVEIHLLIQSAAAYAQLGKRGEAAAQLREALSLAAPDGFAMPFAENYHSLREILLDCRQPELDALLRQVETLGEVYERRCAAWDKENTRPAALAALTERELTVARLMGERLSNREIAEKLFLSEGSVKQYINQIYSKLHIEGAPRARRQALAALLNS